MREREREEEGRQEEGERERERERYFLKDKWEAQKNLSDLTLYGQRWPNRSLFNLRILN